VRNALDRLGVSDADQRCGARWAPWRTAAVHHLWASLSVTPPCPPKRSRPTATRATRSSR
jgi:3-methyladenine DNA glycosylase/8-oxoguanine DNA glycosylase